MADKMKKIFSFDYSKKIGILVKKKKNFLVLEETFDLRNLNEIEFMDRLEKLIKKYKSILSVEFENFINQEIALPPIKDKKTKEFVLKNKLSAHIEKNKNYKFIPIPERNIENKIFYNVYAVPLEILFKNIKIDIELKKKLQKFSLSQFSLLGISNHLFHQKNVFHIYSDDKSMIITVSQGENLKYTRVVDLPENLEPNQLTNIYYENINLTYQYVIQNKAKNIDLILFSGKLSENKEVVEMSYNFLKKPVAVIFKESLIKNCDKEIFNNFIIPIGNIFVPELYNLLPDEFIENKTFNKILVAANFILFIGIIFGVYYQYSEFNNLQKKLSILDKKHRIIKEEIQKFKQSYRFKIEDIDFYAKYFSVVSYTKEFSTLAFIKEIKNLISGTEIQKLNIEKKDGVVILKINAKKQFSNLNDFINFKEKIKAFVAKLSSNWEINDRTRFNFEKLEIIIDLSLMKNTGVML